MNKIWLCFLAGPGSIEDIDELVSPVIQYFDGLKVMFHGSVDSVEGQYLEAHKKSGKIVYGEYVGRHDHSRCRLLYETGIKQNDFLVSLDCLERVAIPFAQDLRNTIEWMKMNMIDVIYYYSKPYVIRFREDMYHQGSPHESFRGDYPIKGVELSHQFPDESKIRINVRPLKRKDPKNWIVHYARYYLLPGTNQCLLGIEHRGDPQELFPKRDAIRLQFRAYLEFRGYEATVDDVVEMFKCGLDDDLRYFLANEKILNDLWRHYIMEDYSTIDEHEWKSMIKIE